jgi:hypothetical protein
VLWQNVRATKGIYPLTVEAKILAKPIPMGVWQVSTVVAVAGLMVASGTPAYKFIFGGSLVVVALLLFFRFAPLASRISGAIAKEQDQQRYELLSLTAIGHIGAAWLVGCTIVKIALNLLPIQSQEQELAKQSEMRFIAGFLIIWLLLIMFGVGSLFSELFGYYSPVAGLAIIGFSLVALLFAIMCDLDQTPTISALVGMLVPLFIRSPLEARIMAFVFYLLAHAGSFTVALALALVFIPLWYESLMLEGWVTDALLPVVQFAVFFGIREGTIWLLWRWLCRRLRADPAELDLAMWLKL